MLLLKPPVPHFYMQLLSFRKPLTNPSAEQWRSQDIAVARAQHGHTTFVRTSARSAEAYRGVWGHPPPPPPRILQPPRSVLRPYTVAKCKSLTAKLAYDERIRLDRNSVLYIAMLRRSISRPFSARFAINNATISAAPMGHGL